MWVGDKSEVDPEFLASGTLGDFWNTFCNNTTFVSPASRKIHKLDWYILVKDETVTDEAQRSSVSSNSLLLCGFF